MSSRPPLCSRHEDRMEGDARARGGAEGIEAKFTWISYVWGEVNSEVFVESLLLLHHRTQSLVGGGCSLKSGVQHTSPQN